MKTFKELFVTTDKDRKNVIEEATWGDARLASVDAKRVLEKNKFEVSKITSNGFKLTHKETGCVGSVVFDPALEESALDESRTIKSKIIIEASDMIVRDYGRPSPKNKEFKKDYIVIFKNKKHGKYFDAWNYDLGFEANISQEEIDNETKPVSSAEAEAFIKYMKSQEESL